MKSKHLRSAQQMDLHVARQLNELFRQLKFLLVKKHSVESLMCLGKRLTGIHLTKKAYKPKLSTNPPLHLLNKKPVHKFLKQVSKLSTLSFPLPKEEKSVFSEALELVKQLSTRNSSAISPSNTAVTQSLQALENVPEKEQTFGLK